jgi:hypothetical protein
VSYLHIYNTDLETITSPVSDIKAVNVSHNGRRTALAFPQLKIIEFSAKNELDRLCKPDDSCVASFQGLFATNLPALAKAVSEHDGLALHQQHHFRSPTPIARLRQRLLSG